MGALLRAAVRRSIHDTVGVLVLLRLYIDRPAVCVPLAAAAAAGCSLCLLRWLPRARHSTPGP
jgi:hypothetical protein